VTRGGADVSCPGAACGPSTPSARGWDRTSRPPTRGLWPAAALAALRSPPEGDFSHEFTSSDGQGCRSGRLSPMRRWRREHPRSPRCRRRCVHSAASTSSRTAMPAASWWARATVESTLTIDRSTCPAGAPRRSSRPSSARRCRVTPMPGTGGRPSARRRARRHVPPRSAGTEPPDHPLNCWGNRSGCGPNLPIGRNGST
jgi:hypothetical protein